MSIDTGSGPAGPGGRRPRSGTGGVQSIERAFVLLEAIAANGGVMGLSQMAAESGLPLPTIHRLVRTLVGIGYLRQDSSRHYVLGPRLIHLGESASGTLAVWARPHLNELVAQLGESANLAMLDGDQIVYIAQAESRRSMRMFTEVGRRVLPHCTAVGKAIMAEMPPGDVAAILQRTGLPRYTENTITDVDELNASLAWSREHGYATDEGEQELGVRCVAVTVPDAPARLALSVSGPGLRMTDQIVAKAVPLLRAAGTELAQDLSVA